MLPSDTQKLKLQFLYTLQLQKKRHSYPQIIEIYFCIKQGEKRKYNIKKI